MNKKIIALALATLVAGAAQAQLAAFKVNGETVSVAQQQTVYDALVAQGQPAGADLERLVKNAMIERTVMLQEAKKAKVENDAKVKAAIKEAQDQILINGYLQQLAQQNPVSDADLQKAYDNEKRNYGDTEYHVRHIVVQTEDQAKDVIARLGKGQDFAKLASDLSIDTNSKARGGDLGWIVPKSTPSTFGAAFSVLKAGDVSQQPIRLQDGFHIVKLEATRPAQNFPKYDQLKNQLRQALLNQRVQQKVQEIVRGADVK